jgi:hypothetical protein
MIRRRSAGVSDAQAAISVRVRRQPRHSPVVESMLQTSMQGVSISAPGLVRGENPHKANLI